MRTPPQGVGGAARLSLAVAGSNMDIRGGLRSDCLWASLTSTVLQQRIDRLGRLSFLQLFSFLGAMLSCELVILFTSSTSFITVRSPYSRVADSECWLSLLTYDNQINILN